MGKSADEEQNIPASVGEAAAERNARWRWAGCCCGWISSFVSLRCVLVLAFSAAVLLSALFWLPPFLGLTNRRDLDLDPRFKDHRIVASFNVEKPVSFLEANFLQLEKDIFDEISFPMTKIAVLSLEHLSNSNITKVVFGIDPEKKNSKIPPEILSLIKAAFESLVTEQLSFRLTESLFGQPFLFEVLKFPGGITVIPLQPIFPLQKGQVVFNFTLNYSIYQIQTNFNELASQLKKGIHLTTYENLYITLSNSRGSTVAPPTTVQSSVLLTIGNTPSRLKQLAQTITGSHSKNLGLNHTVFGKVKQVRLSSILQHSLNGGDGSSTSWSPSPAPQPEPHQQHHHHHCHHHRRHHHHHHHDENGYLAPKLAPEPSPHRHSTPTKGFAPAPAPTKHSHLPWKSYNANAPCHSRYRRRPIGNSGGKHHILAPTSAPRLSPRSSPAPSPHHPPAPSLAPVPHSVPASSPLPNVVFAHIQPPSQPGGTRSISPSPSPSSANVGPTPKRALLLFLIIGVICF